MNKKRLFTASCFALLVTSLTFAVRAGIIGDLGVEFSLSDTELGYVNMMAFLGFPLATIIGGILYNEIGAKKMMWLAFICHILGLVLTITAGGFWGLIVSTFFIGFANGSVEAGCNPMIADMYPEDRTTMLNKFHVWFPGGIVIGSLLSKFLSDANMGWEIQVGLLIIPTLIYAFLILGQEFPKNENLVASTGMNAKALLNPLFLFMAFCMTLTATTELGTQQWIEKILGSAGASPMLVLALVTGLMAVGRYFAGPVVHRLNPIGVLFFSAIIATAGIFLMSQATGGMVYVAAILFAIGVMYFWPTMIGFTSEYLSDTGALGMSLVGGIGMFATAMWQPVIGGWLDSERAAAVGRGLSEEAAELAAGQATLDNLAVFPFILIICFGLLFFMRKKLEEKRLVHTSEIDPNLIA